MGSKRLALELKLSEEDALALMDQYFELFPSRSGSQCGNLCVDDGSRFRTKGMG